jgi:aquaporin Z
MSNPPSKRGLHWAEYFIEAFGLGVFMLAANACAVLVFHPVSPVQRWFPEPFAQRALMGLCMGLCLIGIVYSPWGSRSGAHLNPAFSLTFWSLGKMSATDTVAYSISHFAGGAVGMGIAYLVLGKLVASPSVNYVATLPGARGAPAAFGGEFIISFLLLLVVLFVSNRPSIARYTGICAGICLSVFIALESPISGTSLNPARTVASALFANDWTALWVYFIAPTLGMLTAATAYTLAEGRAAVFCAKLNHRPGVPCLFCNYHRTNAPLH